MFKKKKRKTKRTTFDNSHYYHHHHFHHTCYHCSFHFSPLTDWVVGGEGGGMTDSSAEILLQTFLQEAMVSRSGIGRDVHSLILSIQPFLCRPGCCVLKDGFGEAVVVCGVPEPCMFSSLDSCQMRFLWTYKEVDLASLSPHYQCLRHDLDIDAFTSAVGDQHRHG